MDNIQGTVQEAPKGQAEPTVEQMPNVQTGDTTPEVQKSPEGTTFAELAAKKGFKSPDELAKSYANLESHSKKVEMEKSKLEGLFFSENNQEQPAKVQATPDDQAVAELDKFVSERTQKAVAEAEKKFKQELARIELRETLKENPDFGKYANEVKDLKGKYPNMSFNEAYVLAKAQRGDLAGEARMKGMTESAQLLSQQQQAQVASAKQSSEQKVGATDLLQGASSRWKVAPFGKGIGSRSQAEIEQIEKELFGQVLLKTDQGL